MEIIRNCSHYSFVQVAIVLDENAVPMKVVKTAFNEEGAKSIKTEYEGVCWYDGKLNTASNTVISFNNYKDSFCRLELMYKNGDLGNLNLSLVKNYKKIYNALNHYFDIFRAKECVVSHGDYSIDNMLFAKDDIVWIMDWENFNDKLPNEFDIVYCVMEACYFCYKKHNKLAAKEVDKAIDLLKYGIQKLNMSYDMIIRCPASYMRKLFIDNKSVFGSQITKYPLVNCPDRDILTIDDAFLKRALL